jgi:hypothetical protein
MACYSLQATAAVKVRINIKAESTYHGAARVTICRISKGHVAYWSHVMVIQMNKEINFAFKMRRMRINNVSIPQNFFFYPCTEILNKSKTED